MIDENGLDGGNRIIYTEEIRKNIGIKYTGVNNPNYGNKWNNELKKQVSNTRKKQYKEGFISPTLGLERNDLSERNKLTKGFIWIHKDGKAKQIEKSKLHIYLYSGWDKGMRSIEKIHKPKRIVCQYQNGIKLNEFSSLKEAFRSLENPEYGYDEFWKRIKNSEPYSGYDWCYDFK
jgi:hypothetical protein